MGRIAGLVVALLVLSAVFWLIESLFAANPRQARFYKRRGFRTDVVYWFVTTLVTKTISQIGLALLLIVLYRQNVPAIRDMLLNRDTWLARQPLWLQAVEMIAVGDFIGYWIHRWFHSRRMWAFHAIHHCSKDLDWFSTARVHPVNDWLARWIQASAAVVLGFSPAAVAAYLPFLNLHAILLHANVPWGFGRLGWLVASPKFHRWHHTSEDEGLDKNFAGMFPIIDMIFGTYYMPADRLPERFGLKEDGISEGFLSQMTYPFLSSRRFL